LQENLKDLHKDQHDQLVRVLQKRGFKQPLNLWLHAGTYHLMDGHQRHRVMTANDMNDNGSYEVPYFLTEAKNKKEAVEQLLEITSQYGKTTPDGLDELASMYELELGELDVHFDAIDLEKLMDSMNEEVEEDEAPEVDEVNSPVSVLGQVYQLGVHRLMCGSATEIEDVKTLLDGFLPELVLTDPPYGVDIVQNQQVGGAASTHFGGKVGAVVESSTYAEILNDDTTETAQASMDIIGELGIKNRIIWGGNYFTDFLPPRACWIVWNKKNTGNFADVEMAWTSFTTGAKLYDHMWNGMAREGAREDELATRVHPTQKPVGLHANILRDFSKKGDQVLDLFGGSGTTLIACERTERICYMLELSPSYCDVIRKRYAKLIGAEDWEVATPEVVPVAA
jgi:16S rRNA G966 N2-methylase RsmD